jgi:hypothetical protein
MRSDGEGGTVMHIFIKHSSTFWEVRPPNQAGMRKLLAYIRMCKRAANSAPEPEKESSK